MRNPSIISWKILQNCKEDKISGENTVENFSETRWILGAKISEFGQILSKIYPDAEKVNLGDNFEFGENILNFFKKIVFFVNELTNRRNIS